MRIAKKLGLWMIMLVTLMGIVQGISIDKSSYLVDDTVSINLGNYEDEEISVVIEFGADTYRFLGDPGQNIQFIPRNEGDYSVRVENLDGNVLSRASFEVTGATEVNQALVYLGTDKKNYETGETAYISTSFQGRETSELTIISETNIYRFLGEITGELRFVPREVGKHEIKISDGNSVIAYHTFNVHSTRTDNGRIEIEEKNYSVNDNVKIFLYDLKNKLYKIRISNDDESFLYMRYEENIINFTPKNSGIYTAELLDGNNFIASAAFNVGDVQNAWEVNNIRNWFKIGDNSNQAIDEIAVKIYKNNNLLDKIQENQTYDVEFDLNNTAVKNIMFRNLELSSGFDLGIDDVPEDKINIGNKKAVNSFAIDPTKLNFTDATVTSTAKGNSLWKCKDWNFSTQECYGRWEKISDLVPGNDYSFILTPADPGYAEIFAKDAFHLDANRTFVSNIFNEIQALDSNWSERIYHDEYVRVIFEQALGPANDITFYARNILGLNTTVEVYYFNSSTKITEFPIINSEQYYKVYLTGMTGKSDTFDLRIKNNNNNNSAYLEFDHIIDPYTNFTANSCVYIDDGGSGICTETDLDSADGTNFVSLSTDGSTVNFTVNFVQDIPDGSYDISARAWITHRNSNNVRVSNEVVSYNGSGSFIQQGQVMLENGDNVWITENRTITGIDTESEAEDVWLRYQCTSTSQAGPKTCQVDMLLLEINYTENQPPYWYNNETNDTQIFQGETVMFNSTWDDAKSLGYWIFSTNLTGSWINTTASAFSGEPEEVSNVHYINQSPGFGVGWRFHANDTENVWNMTDVYSFTVLGIKWNDTSSFNFGTIEAGDESFYNRDVLVYGTNNNVQVGCTGDCNVITSNFTNGVSLSTGTTIRFNCSSIYIGTHNANYSVYSANDIVYDNFSLSCTVQDTRSPSWNNNRTNDTLIYQGESVLFNVTWTDNSALNYSIFSTNFTGNWINSSPVALDSRNDSAYDVRYINHSPGYSVGWMFHANDSVDLWNHTDFFSFTVLGVVWNTTESYDFGTLQSGEVGEHFRDIYSYGPNSNVDLSCIGDCGAIKHNISNPVSTSDGEVYTVRFNCSDAIGVYSANFSLYSDEDKVLENVSYTCSVVAELIPPYWNNNKTYPLTGINYSYGQSYSFNTTWFDNVAVLNVTIEHNFTTVLENYSVSNVSNEFYYQTTDLAGGSYVWRMYANDTAGNWNVTDQWVYLISRSTSRVNLTLNSSYADRTINIGETVNITGFREKPNYGNIQLLEDGIQFASGNTPLTNIRQFPSAGYFNITVAYPGNHNYSRSIETLFVTVKDTVLPSVSLTYPEDAAHTAATIVNFTFTPFDNLALKNATLWTNFTGVWNTNITNTTAMVSDILYSLNVSNIAEGNYIWNIRVADSYNNTNYASQNYSITIDRTPPTKASLLSPLNETASRQWNPVLQWSQTNEINFANYTIQVDNDPGFGLVGQYYIYNTFNITNTTYIVDDNWPTGEHWFWRVISIDKAGNDNYSDIFRYSVDRETPNVESITGNNTFRKTNFVYLHYNVNDFTNIQNCTLWVNGLSNHTNFSVSKGTQQNFSVFYGNEGTFDWFVNCTDEAGNTNVTETRVLTIDTVLPTAFNLDYPLNGSIKINQTPRLNWSISADDNFANYTLLIDDNEDFSSPERTYYTNTSTNNSYLVGSNLAEGTWYWKATAYDRANNTRISTNYFTYIIDTSIPAPFNVLTPFNNTASRNNTPTLRWEQTTDNYFSNYTIYISDDINFGYYNITYYTYDIADTSYFVTGAWDNDVKYYWYVQATDNASNKRNSTDYYLYITDVTDPSINLTSPSENEQVKSSVVLFQYNVSDLSDVDNCSLYIDGNLERTETIIFPEQINIISHTLSNAIYTWYVNCSDAAGNNNKSLSRTVNVNVTLPTYRFYETYPGGGGLPGPIDVSMNRTIETANIITYPNVPATVSNMNNATSPFMSNFSTFGFIIPASSTIAFSNYIDIQTPLFGTIAWSIHKVNSSGVYPICGTPYVSITSTAYNTYTSSCVSPNYNLFFDTLDQFRVITNVTGAAGSNKDMFKQVDHASTYIDIQGYALGNLTAKLIVPTIDPKPSEGSTFNLSCLLNCTSGFCLETNAHAEANTSMKLWYEVDTDPLNNILLNGTQTNPIVIGAFNETRWANFTLLGNNLSYDNNIRCVVHSTYANATSSVQNVSVLDIVAPNVSLALPSPGYAAEPGNFSFSFIPKDKHLRNCSLYGNFSDIWGINVTNTTPNSDQQNSLGPIYLSYGVYSWNVGCYDLSNNLNFSTANRSLVIAGDLEVNSEDIVFEKQNPVEGEIIRINATIHNLANKNESYIVVAFYEGDPLLGKQINGNRTINVSALSNTTTYVNWTVQPGNTTVYVVADVNNTVIESDESNNQAYNSVLVEGYQVFFGEAVGNIYLDKENNDSVFAWMNKTNISGNVYVSDSDSKIDWSSLVAIGRDDNNNPQSNDWEEADKFLYMENLTDSLNRTYTDKSAARKLINFTLMDVPVINVSIVNSTNTSNFVTGILWDRSDSDSNNFYDAEQEDLLFVTQINNNMPGKYGTYDYEIKVPGNLRRYVIPNTENKVKLYVEIT